MATKLLLLSALILSSCAHTSPSASSPSLIVLPPNDKLLSMSPPAYSKPEDKYFQVKGSTAFLRIRSTAEESIAFAREETQRRLALLTQYAQIQADPYSGPIDPKFSACSVDEKKSATEGLLGRANLVVSKALAVNCYSKGSGQLWEERQFHYCPRLHTLFEISLFVPQGERAPPASSLGACPAL